MDSPSKNMLFSHLRSTLKSIKEKEEFFVQNKQTQQLLQNITQQQNTAKQEDQIKRLTTELYKKEKQVKNLTSKVQALENGEIQSFKKQLRRLVQSINEKQIEMDNLRRLSNRQKNRITVLQADLQTLASTKDTLQNSILKIIEQIKGDLKTTNSISEEIQLERYLLQNKYRQFGQKLDVTLKMEIQLENKRKHLEESYRKVKLQNAALFDNNMDLQAEVLRLKKVKNNQQIVSKATKSKSIKSKAQDYFDQQTKQKPNTTFEYIESFLQQFQSNNNFLDALENKSEQIKKNLKEKQILLQQIDKYKEANKALNQEIINLRTKYENPSYSQKFLKTQYSNIYDFFSRKKQEVQNFQSRIEGIQELLFQKIQMIQECLRNKDFFQANKENKENKENKQNKQKDERIKNQIQNLNIQLKVHKAQVEALNLQIQLLKDVEDSQKKEINDLKTLNESLKQQLNSVRIRSRETQGSVSNSSLSKGQTHSQKSKYIKIQQDKRDQAENFYKGQLTLLADKINKYKEQLRYIQERDKFKKNKPIRCQYCLLRIEQGSDVQFKKCAKCKKLYHQIQCFQEHKQECKTTTAVNRKSLPNKRAKSIPKSKKPSANVEKKKIEEDALDYL